MIALDCHDRNLKKILTAELPLSERAMFQSRDILKGTQLFNYSFCTIADNGITWILIGGTFVATDVYILMKTNFEEEFSFYRLADELKSIGLDPAKTRLVCVAKNISEGVPGGQKLPEIQIFRIPY